MIVQTCTEFAQCQCGELHCVEVDYARLPVQISALDPLPPTRVKDRSVQLDAPCPRYPGKRVRARFAPAWDEHIVRVGCPFLKIGVLA